MPTLTALGIVVRDMADTIRFYRLLGLDVPETPGEGHVHVEMPGGIRLMFDTEAVMQSFRPEWSRVAGNQVALAIECADSAEVDELYARVVAAGFESEKEPWDAFWGQHYAQLRDPNGVPVDLFASLE